MTSKGLEDAQILALRALAHLLNDERTCNALLVQTGVDAADLRRFASSREFLAGIMAFLLGDERRARDFCTAESVEPDELRLAQALLSGHKAGPESTA